MNIDKQIEKIIDSSQTYNCYSLEYEMILEKSKIVNKIKQSILKAIMEGKPKKDRTMMFVDEAKRLMGIGYNKAIKEFESVIKEVLDTKPII